MHIEFRHLRTIKAIHDTGSVAGAAGILHITQSALSHQIKAIEDQVGVELFVRRSKPLRLSAAGARLLAAAERILPEIEALEAEFAAVEEGSLGRLHVGVETAAALDWVVPVLDQFRRVWPQVDLDLRISDGDPFEALRREEADVIITTEAMPQREIAFVPLFDYEPRLVASAKSPFAQRAFVAARDMGGAKLIDYPVDRLRSDAAFLGKDSAVLAARRCVEMTDVILMLVAAGQGVAVLPDWTLDRLKGKQDMVSLPLMEAGLTRRIQAALRDEDVTKPYVAHLLRLARQEAVRLQRR